MKYFLDTEFFEDGYKRIDLISIALVCEDGREYYAVAKDGWEPQWVSDWLKENVLPFLSISGQRLPFLGKFGVIALVDNAHQFPFRSREQIRLDLIEFLHPNTDPHPELWGYFCDYDWVLFCQLFGRMIDLPTHFPKYCRDVKQLQDQLRVSKALMPKQQQGNHNALQDARHIQEMHKFLADGWPSSKQHRVDLINAELKIDRPSEALRSVQTDARTTTWIGETKPDGQLLADALKQTPK